MTLALALLAIGSSWLCAQSATSPVYVDQMKNLGEQTKLLFAEISESEPRWAKSPTAQHALHERLNALQILAHRLEETADQENLRLLQSGLPHDKRLLLVGQGCKAIDFAVIALTNYVWTDDHIFIRLANDGIDLMASVRKSI